MYKYLILLVTSFLYSEIILKPSYCTKQSIIKKSFFTKDKKDTQILVKLPKSFKTFTVASIKISREFKDVKDISGGVIKFKRCYKSNNNLSVIKQKFIEHLKAKIPNIKIESLKIEKISKKPFKNIIDIKVNNIFNRGFFKAILDDGNEVNFKYELKAKIGVFVSTKVITKGTKITGLDITSSYINIRKRSFILNIGDIIDNIAKVRIPKNKPIQTYMIKKENLIKRGDEIMALYTDDLIEVSVEVKALRNGVKNEIISAITPSGKILKVKVVNSHLVIVL